MPGEPGGAPWADPARLEQAALAILGGRVAEREIAARAGYGTWRAFAAAFTATFQVRPADLRGWARAGRYPLGYGGPFHVAQTLRYLGRDPENLAERVKGTRYRRHYPLAGGMALVTLRFRAEGCTVEAARPRAAADAWALHRLLRRSLGLDQPLADFYRHAGEHAPLRALTRQFAGVRIPQLPSLWEALCWAVVGQQINLAFAYRLRNRLIALGNGLSAPPYPPLPAPAGDAAGLPTEPLPFPKPEQVLRLTAGTLLAHQFSRQKAAYLLGLARACAEGTLDEAVLARLPAEEAEARLLAQRGLGPWSAAYVLMRGLGHPDALPVGDTGLRTALQLAFRLRHPPDARRQVALMEPFRPYRSLTTYYLWKSLGSAPGG
jgi:3-methyladenine DNA glycosylase/8-oxoguanine DNA glycosylase